MVAVVSVIPKKQTAASKARQNRRAIEVQQKVGPGPWVYVGDYPDDTFTRPESPTWQNSLESRAGRRVKFRWGLDGSLDMEGSFDLTLGYTTGQVGFNVNENTDEFEGEGFEDRIPIEIDDGVWTFGVAVLEAVDRGSYVAGDFHIDWPIVADPIP